MVERRKLDEYVARTAMIMRMFIFILLGSQVDFSLMSKFMLVGVFIVIIFMLIARPVTVFVCALPDRRVEWSFNEMLLMCWTRETVVIPVALAGLLIGKHMPGAEIIAAVTFVSILMPILIKATTAKWLAGKLGLLDKQLSTSHLGLNPVSSRVLAGCFSVLLKNWDHFAFWNEGHHLIPIRFGFLCDDFPSRDICRTKVDNFPKP